MCGLAGVAGWITAADEKAFQNLMLFSQVRGIDSTGIGAVLRQTDHEIRVIKDTVTSTDLMYYDNRVDKLFTKPLNVLIGHCRAATKGRVVKKNAHPFLVGKILGAHNGTLSYATQAIHKKVQDTDTDSEGLFVSIDQLGPKAAIEGMESSDAYALSWYNSDDHTISLCHNNLRPLVYALGEAGKTIYWASEAVLLGAALIRNDVKINTTVGIAEVPINHVFTWEVPADFQSTLKEPISVKAEPQRKAAYTGYNRMFNQGGGNDTGAPFDHGGKATTAGTSVVPFKRPDDSLRFTRKTGNGSRVESVWGPNGYHSEKLLPNRPAKAPPTVTAHQSVLYRDVVGGLHLLFDKELGLFKTHRWDRTKQAWEVLRWGTTPTIIPFNTLDTSARHEFKTIKERINGVKTSVQYYKGFGGKLLNQKEFEGVVSNGCSCCGRAPVWGNKVNFYDADDHFLCEYCSAVPDLNLIIRPLRAEGMK